MAKKTRTREEIANEYAKAAAELGDAVYRLDFAIPEQIRDLKQKMAALNAEAASLKET